MNDNRPRLRRIDALSFWLLIAAIGFGLYGVLSIGNPCEEHGICIVKGKAHNVTSAK